MRLKLTKFKDRFISKISSDDRGQIFKTQSENKSSQLFQTDVQLEAGTDFPQGKWGKRLGPQIPI